MLKCELCGNPIEHPREAWKQTVGWVSPRGAKAMTGAKPTGKLAHPVCVVALRHHISVDQLTLS